MAVYNSMLHWRMYLVFCVVIIISSMISIEVLRGDGYNEDGTPSCTWTYFDPHCSPSGWISFIIGEVVLAVILGLLLYFLSSRSNEKISETTRQIQNILQQQHELRARRTIYVVHALKDHFGTLLLSLGIMNRALQKAKSYEDVQVSIRERYRIVPISVQRAYDILSIAADLLDPMLTEDIRNILQKIETIDPATGVGKGFPNYDLIKEGIRQCTGGLNESMDNDPILK